MTDEKAAKKYKEISLLVDSVELEMKMQPYYDLIEAAKQSMYGRFLSTDMSVKSLKECIKTEAVMLDAVNENVCLGVQRQDVINSLKPIYKEYKKSFDNHATKPPFFHVNSLRKEGSVLFHQFVSFTPPLLKFDAYGNMVICNGCIPLPGIRELVRDIEERDCCKLSRLTFKDVGYGEVDNTIYENLTYIEIRFEVE